MSKSMFDTKKGTCFICGCHGYTEKHHIFGGVANRRLSEADGLWVYLCPVTVLLHLDFGRFILCDEYFTFSACVHHSKLLTALFPLSISL